MSAPAGSPAHRSAAARPDSDTGPTPALLVDLEQARSNIAVMARICADEQVALRPHAKVHKSVELARLQVTAGAVGITVATVAEARAFAAGGIGSILIANQIPLWAADEVAALAAGIDLVVLVDDIAQLVALDTAARARGSVVGVLVELDIGMGRGGARSRQEAVALVRRAVDLPGVDWRGIEGYEGHCSDDPDPHRRDARTRVALDRLGGLAAELTAEGLTPKVVSAGSTGTFRTATTHPAVTEIQAGSYVLMDAFHAALVDDFSFAVRVQATVVARHGDLAVVDAGRKSLGRDLADPLPPPGASLAFMHEEHSGWRYPDGAPELGSRVALVPGYTPLAVNLVPRLRVADATWGPTTILEWPVVGRHQG